MNFQEFQEMITSEDGKEYEEILEKQKRNLKMKKNVFDLGLKNELLVKVDPMTERDQ